MGLRFDQVFKKIFEKNSINQSRNTALKALVEESGQATESRENERGKICVYIMSE